MNVKRFLSDSFRRNIDSKINTIVTNHNVAKKSASETTKSIKKRCPRKTYLGAKLTEEDAAEIYICKCQDLDLVPNSSAKMRFVEQFINSIQKKSLRFSGLGLGPTSTKKLMELIYDKQQYFLLDLSLNRLNDEGANYIAQYLQSDPEIIYVDLRSNAIGIKGCTDIFTGLLNNCHVTCLDISAIDGIDRNRLGSQGAKALARVLQENQVISHLNVSMSGLTADGCKYIGDSLTKNKSLIYLDLSANRFGSTGAISLFTKENSFGSIESLILSKNLIGDDAMPVITKQMKRAKNLRVLDLSFNNLTSNAVKFINDAYEGGSNVSILSLAGNSINAGGVEYITHVLSSTNVLKVLNLSNNEFGDAGIKKLVKSLHQNKSLSSLDLSQTGCCDEAAKEIAELLKENTNISKLVLEKNKITDEGGIAIFEALETNKSIVALSLKSNEMKDGTASAIIKTLKTNTTVGDIDVSMNDFSYKSYVKVEQLIEEHKKTLNSNIADVAEKHVDWLKSEEQRLFKFREDIKEQEIIVENTSVKKTIHLEELDMLKKSCNEQMQKMDEELEAARNAHEEASIERQNVQYETNRIKMELEQREADAKNEFQNKAINRQRAESKYRKLEAEREEQLKQHNEKISELNAELKITVDKLKETIQSALYEKKRMEDEERMAEANQKAEALAAAKAAKKAKKKAGGKKKSKAAKPEAQIISPKPKPSGRATTANRRL